MRIEWLIIQPRQTGGVHAIIYVAAVLVSFGLGKAIDEGQARQQAKESETQRIEQVQRPADLPENTSDEPVAWVLPSLGTP